MTAFDPMSADELAQALTVAFLGIPLTVGLLVAGVLWLGRRT